jgi:hypothetical protein
MDSKVSKCIPYPNISPIDLRNSHSLQGSISASTKNGGGGSYNSAKPPARKHFPGAASPKVLPTTLNAGGSSSKPFHSVHTL